MFFVLSSFLLFGCGVSVSSSVRFGGLSYDGPAFNPALSAYINSLNTTWRASKVPHGLFANRTFREARKLMGVLKGGPGLPRKVYDVSGMGFPKFFDAEKRWPGCWTIGDIRDQSACGSCWAFAAAESMSDRYCTYFGEEDPEYRNVSIAATDLLACCGSCGMGCEGGFPGAAWQYWVDRGLVDEGCEKYPFPRCAHHEKGHPPLYPMCPSRIYPTPSCPVRCADGSPVGGARRYYGESSWSLEGEEQFMAELMQNGPFEVTMAVYEVCVCVCGARQDFEHYESGIYQHKTGAYMGGHAVKVVGWGEEDGVKYWRIANSWNPTWGEKGFFRILRGVNECGIESSGTAGKPRRGGGLG